MTVENEAQMPQMAALLSAVSDNSEGEAASAKLPRLCSVPLLLIQARQLHQRGVSPIAVEVDHMGGALTGVLDQLRLEGIDITAVRSVAELQEHVGTQRRLLVIRSSLYIGEEMMDNLVSSPNNRALTLPADHAEQGFERIDLGSLWTGIALLPGEIVGTIGELPDGYSLPSALLRHAIQSGVSLSDTQKDAKNDALILLGDETSVQRAEDCEFRLSGDNGKHWPEAFLLRPLSAALITVAGEKTRLTEYLWPASALVVVGLAAFAFLPAALAMLLIAITIFNIKNMIENIERKKKNSIFFNQSGALLSVTILISGWHMGGWYGLFSAFVFAGLFMAAQNLAKLGMTRQFVLSPLLATTLFLIAASIGFLPELIAGYALLLVVLMLFDAYFPQESE